MDLLERMEQGRKEERSKDGEKKRKRKDWELCGTTHDTHHLSRVRNLEVHRTNTPYVELISMHIRKCIKNLRPEGMDPGVWIRRLLNVGLDESGGGVHEKTSGILK